MTFLFSKCKFKFIKCRWDSTLKSISFDNQKLIINTVVLYYYFQSGMFIQGISFNFIGSQIHKNESKQNTKPNKTKRKSNSRIVNYKCCFICSLFNLIPHCLGSLIWIKKSILSRDCYSSQNYAKPDWNLPKLKFFDWLFKRKLSFCVLPINATMKTKDMREVHHVQILMLTVLTEKNILKNIFSHLITISIPKVAKNGLKVPNEALLWKYSIYT